MTGHESLMDDRCACLWCRVARFERRVKLARRIAWNRLQAKLHHAYPCGRCGYRYDCPDGECHS